MKIKGKKKEVVTQTMYELDGVKCDVCGRIIEPPSKEKQSQWMNDDYKYYFVTIGHNDWDNSIEHFDICPNCINNFVVDYLSDEDPWSDYINIKTSHLVHKGKIYEGELDNSD